MSSMEEAIQRARAAQQNRKQDQQQEQQRIYHIKHPNQAETLQQATGVPTDAPPPAYLLDWDAPGGGSRKTALATAGEWRAALEAATARSDGSSNQWRLFVLHGLPAGHLDAVLACLDVDPAFVEAHAGRYRYRPALRRRRRAQTNETETRFAVYEYPELVQRTATMSRETTVSRRFVDLMDAPPVVATMAAPKTGTGNVAATAAAAAAAAVFCRASLWATATGNVAVMFLDRPVWSSDPGSQLRKARRATGAVTEPFSVSPRDTTVASEKQTAKGDDDDEWDVLLSEGCQTASLEDTLVDALEHGIFDVVERGVVGDEAGGLQHVLSELAYDHWLELFEFLGLGIVSLFHRRREQAACCWRMLESLERNADMAGFLERQQRSRELRTSLDRGRVTDVAGLQQGTGCLYTSSDWKELASRVHERIALLVSSPLKPDPSSLAGSTTRTRSSKTSASSRKISRTNTMDASQQQQTDGSAVNNNNDRRSLLPRPSADENQRALDRVSYLGGILIPMPIVSGILSMGDTFGPYGDKFFVFWAAALPLSVLAVLIIYADTIRKAEVWVEIAAERVVPSSSPSSSSGDSEVPVKFDFKEHRKVTWQARKSKRPPSNDEPPVPERMAPETLAELRMDYDIEERIIDMPSARVAEGVDHFMTNVVTGVTSDEDEGDEARPESIAVAPPFLRAATDELRPPPPMILERPSDGSKPRAWKRQSLGWVGAVKSMVGARPRRGDDVPRGIAACEKPGRRKTRTY